MKLTLLIPLAGLFAACGGTTSIAPSDGGTAQDHSEPQPEASQGDGPSQGDAPSEAAVMPEGGSGVCCSIVTDPCSACGGGPGGWAPSAAACATSGPCDGYIGFGTDSHGCPVVVAGVGLPGTKCCGCADTGTGEAEAGDGSVGDADAASGKGSGQTCTPGASDCAAGLSCCACPLPNCTAPPTCEQVDPHGICPG